MRMGALIVAGAIGFVLSILALGSRVEAQTSPKATGGQDASSNAAAAIASEAKNKNFDLSTISRAIADEASRLKNDAAGWVQKLQQLELDLNKTQQDDEAAARDLDEVTRGASGGCRPAWAGRGSQSHTAQRRGCRSRAREFARRYIRSQRSARQPAISSRRPASCAL